MYEQREQLTHQKGLTAATSDATKLQLLFKELNHQANDLENHVNRIENVGHRLNNTNYPTDAANKLSPAPEEFEEGLLRELDHLIKRFGNLNYRINNSATKLESII